MEGRLNVVNMYVTPENRVFVKKYQRIVKMMVYGNDERLYSDPNGLQPALPIVAYSVSQPICITVRKSESFWYCAKLIIICLGDRCCH